MTDDPELDGTDGAHPAWWRGTDCATAVVVRIVNDILDGTHRETSGRFNHGPLNDLRDRLHELMDSAK